MAPPARCGREPESLPAASAAQGGFCSSTHHGQGSAWRTTGPAAPCGSPRSLSNRPTVMQQRQHAYFSYHVAYGSVAMQRSHESTATETDCRTVLSDQQLKVHGSKAGPAHVRMCCKAMQGHVTRDPHKSHSTSRNMRRNLRNLCIESTHLVVVLPWRFAPQAHPLGWLRLALA
jgi:hypothetical protein